MNSPRCNGTVVVVDDEEDIRELLRELIEARGHDVATAKDGLDALAVLDGTPKVCLMILDLVMPRMDGNDLLRQLDAGGRTFPVCISTSAPDRAPAGIPCLVKPIDVPHLLAMIDEQCARNR